MPEIRNFPIKKLTLLDKNPRRITKEQMEKLCSSMKSDPDFLWNRPVLVNEADGKYIVYAGNQRVRAAKSMKMAEIPCIIDKDLDEHVLKERTIKDNKSFGDWDYDLLGNDYEMDILVASGFTAAELLGNLTDELGDDKPSKGEKDKKAKTCPHCGEEI